MDVLFNSLEPEVSGSAAEVSFRVDRCLSSYFKEVERRLESGDIKNPHVRGGLKRNLISKNPCLRCMDRTFVVERLYCIRLPGESAKKEEYCQVIIPSGSIFTIAFDNGQPDAPSILSIGVVSMAFLLNFNLALLTELWKGETGQFSEHLLGVITAALARGDNVTDPRQLE